MQKGLLSASDQLLRQLLFRFIALHLFSARQEVLFGITSLRKSQTGLGTKNSQQWKKFGQQCCRFWRVTHTQFRQWSSRQMAAGWPPDQMTVQCGCGMAQQEQGRGSCRDRECRFGLWPSWKMVACWPLYQGSVQ